MFELSPSDYSAIWLTLKLAAVVTCILLIIGTPIALWLATSQSKAVPWVDALVALPLVLPPTVIGFYLLLAMGPNGPIGAISQWFGVTSFAFSFTGLVIGSVFYSLPFVVQPIRNAIQAIGKRPLEVAATLGAKPIDRFISVILPSAKPGFITAAVLGFAHTIGEFGVILMIGGNIPGETRVVSVQIYDQVESLAYTQAHQLSAIMLIFSFIVLLLVYSLNKQSGKNTRVF